MILRVQQLMEALARARRIGPRIGVVTHADDVPDFDGFRASFGLDIEHRRFATAEDARDCVAGLVAAGTECQTTPSFTH